MAIRKVNSTGPLPATMRLVTMWRKSVARDPALGLEGYCDHPPPLEVLMSVSTPEPPVAASAQAERERQMREAEELLFSGGQRAGFAKALFRGQFRSEALFPYPILPADLQAEADASVSALRKFVAERID